MERSWTGCINLLFSGKGLTRGASFSTSGTVGLTGVVATAGGRTGRELLVGGASL